MIPVDLAFRQGCEFFSECLEAGDTVSAAKATVVLLHLLLVSANDHLLAAEAAAMAPAAEHQLQG